VVNDSLPVEEPRRTEKKKSAGKGSGSSMSGGTVVKRVKVSIKGDSNGVGTGSMPVPTPSAETEAKPAPRPRRRLRKVFLVVPGIATVLSALLGGAGLWLKTREPQSAGAGDKPVVVRPQKPVVVYNKVTSGGRRMVEDINPAVLSTRAVNRCQALDCAMPGTEMRTGVSVNVVCHTRGESTTNGNDSSPTDDTNRELYESDLWYGVQLPDGRVGYLSEVWVRPEDRHGLNLPNCSEI
jgi:hypothetical protein